MAKKGGALPDYEALELIRLEGGVGTSRAEREGAMTLVRRRSVSAGLVASLLVTVLGMALESSTITSKPI